MDMLQWLSDNLVLFITLCLVSLVGLGNFIIFCYGSYILDHFMPYVGLFSGLAITFQTIGACYFIMGCCNLTCISCLFPGTSIANRCPTVTLAVMLWLMTVNGLTIGSSMTGNPSIFPLSASTSSQPMDNATFDDFYDWDWKMRVLNLHFYPRIAQHIERKFLVDYNSTESSSELFDMMQNKLQCCGVNGSQDYAPLNLSVPLSCCEYSYTTRDCTPSQAYSLGCKNVFVTWLRHTLDSVAIITIVFSIIALAAALGTCTLGILNCLE